MEAIGKPELFGDRSRNVGVSIPSIGAAIKFPKCAEAAMAVGRRSRRGRAIIVIVAGVALGAPGLAGAGSAMAFGGDAATAGNAPTSRPNLTEEQRRSAAAQRGNEATEWQSTALASLVIENMRRSFAGRFAGANLDNEEQQLEIRIKGLTAEERTAATQGLPAASRGFVSLTAAAFTEVELLSIQQSLRELVQDRIEYVGSAFDRTAARLIVELLPGSETFAEELRGELPAGSVIFRYTLPGTFVPQEAKTEPNPNGQYKGGKYMPPETGQPCSSGFVYTEGSNFLGSTAGHCTRGTGTRMVVGGIQYGLSYKNGWNITAPRSVYADVVFIKGSPSTNYTPNLIHVNSSFTRKVNGKNPNAISTPGSRVYTSGAGTGFEVSGTITEVQRDVTDQQGSSIYDLTVANYFSYEGDSGTPVYQKNGDTHAIGVGAHVGEYQVGGGFSAVYHDIDNVERALQVRLLTY